MQQASILIILLLFTITSCTDKKSDDQLTDEEMIDRSIQYHDPKGEWKDLNALFIFEDSLPAPRISRSYSVSLDNAHSTMIYAIEDSKYTVIQDSVIVKEGDIEKEQALRMRDYYTFLWGLPMKLKDPGTVIEDKVATVSLKGSDYYEIRVPYEKDIWYIYLTPESYRLAAYKFYQDEANQKGEIIYLSGEREIGGLRIPANRTWYRTEKPEFLATDKLVEIKTQN